MSDMVWKPDVTVAAVAERDGQFLFVEERSGGRVVINQPAGHLENGETFLDAVVRETLEETGWQFRPEAILGVYMWHPEHLTRTFLRIAFAGTLASHDPHRPLDHGILRTRWLARDALLALQPRHRSPMVMNCVDDYLAGVRYPLGMISHLLKPAAASLALAGDGGRQAG